MYHLVNQSCDWIESEHEGEVVRLMGFNLKAASQDQEDLVCLVLPHRKCWQLQKQIMDEHLSKLDGYEGSIGTEYV